MKNKKVLLGHKPIDTKVEVKNPISRGSTSVTIFIPIEKAIAIQDKYPNMSLSQAVRFHILIND